jgi:hypothetical protein
MQAAAEEECARLEAALRAGDALRGWLGLAGVRGAAAMGGRRTVCGGAGSLPLSFSNSTITWQEGQWVV